LEIVGKELYETGKSKDESKNNDFQILKILNIEAVIVWKAENADIIPHIFAKT
jgi:hypothetical protein